MNDQYRIVTVCTHFPTESYYCLTEFFKSLRQEPILVLDREYSNYSGLGSKPKAVYRAIKEGLVDTKHIVFCDCFDLVFSYHPDVLFQAYKSNFKEPVVISSERNCFPSDLKDAYDKFSSMSPYKYLNSGMIVGETEAFLEVLEAMDLRNVPDDYRNSDGSMTHINDQFLYQQIFLKQSVPISLDYQQILCNTLHSVGLDELEFSEGNVIKNKVTGSLPCSFHLNGSAKTDGLREPVIQHLNLL